MPKFFIFDSQSVSYKKYKVFTIKRVLIFLGIQFIIAFLLINFISLFYNTPKERKLKAETDYLLTQFDDVNQKLNRINYLLNDIKEYDSVIYTAIFDYVPNKDKFQSEYIGDSTTGEFINIVNETNEKITILEQRLENQKYVLSVISAKAFSKQEMLASIPSIQPIANKNLKHTSSGWGYRIHPIYRIRIFHFGQDFAMDEDTKVFATGKGKIVSISRNLIGYGNCVVIDHGYGYKTLYGHLHKINVKINQKVNRGDVIGLSGNTGTSTGPHLHYEVIKDGKKINPINYFFNDLTADEYDQMIKISSNIKKSFD